MKKFYFILIASLLAINNVYAENHNGYSGIYYYDENGKLSSADCMFQGSPAHMEYSYENGLKTEKIYINNGQTLFWTITYDEHDNMVRQTTTMGWPDTYVYTNEYDASGNLISKDQKGYYDGVWVGANNSVFHQYTYDSDNNMIKDEEYGYNQDGSTYFNVYTECSWDTPDTANCNFRYADGTLIYPSTRNNQKTYDEYGNVIASNGNTYVWADPEWKSKQATSQGVREIKRIYTIQEATEALGDNGRNTFSIKYR